MILPLQNKIVTGTNEKPKEGNLLGHEFDSYKNYFVLNIANRTGSQINFDLFNPTTDVTDPFYTAITTDSPLTYSSLASNIINNGFLLWYIKIFSDNGNALDSITALNKMCIDSTGETLEFPYIVNTANDIFQRRQDLINIDFRKEPMLLDGKTYLNMTIEPIDADIKIHFYYNKIMKSTPLDVINKLVAID